MANKRKYEGVPEEGGGLGKAVRGSVSAMQARERIVIEISKDGESYLNDRALEIKRELANYWDDNRLGFYVNPNIPNRPGSFRVRVRSTGHILWEQMDMEPPFQPLRDLDVQDFVAGIVQADRTGALMNSQKIKVVFIRMSRDAPAAFDIKAGEIKDGLVLKSRECRVFVVDSKKEDNSGCFIVRSQYGRNYCQLRDMVEPYQPLVELDVNNIVSQIIHESDLAATSSSGRAILIEMSSHGTEVFDTKAEQVAKGLMKSGATQLLVSVEKKEEKPGCFIVRSKNGVIFCELMDMVDPFQQLKDLDVEDVVNQVVQAIADGTI